MPSRPQFRGADRPAWTPAGQARPDELDHWVDAIWDEAIRQETLLLVESHDELRGALAARLSEYGYRVLGARTGGEALHLLERERPDLILLDLVLDDQAGADLAGRIRAQWPAQRLPIVALSTDPVPAHALRGVGIQHLCLMPLHPDDLVAIVERTLEPFRRAGLPDPMAASDPQYGLELADGMRSEHLTLGTWFPARTRFGLTPLNEPVIQHSRRQLLRRGIDSELAVEGDDVVLSYTLTVADALAIGFNAVAPDELFFALVDAYPELIRDPEALRRRIGVLEREFVSLQRLAS